MAGGRARAYSGTGDGSVLAGGPSHLQVSALRLLRLQMDHGGCGPALDGGLNVAGPPEGDRPHLLGVRLDIVSGLLDAFRRACAEAAGTSFDMQLWVRAAELNRDIPRARAPELAHRLAGGPNPWHRVG